MSAHRTLRRRMLAMSLLIAGVLAVLIVVAWKMVLRDTGAWGRYANGGSFYGGHPRVSPNGKDVVYASPRSGHGEIHRINLPTQATVRLTTAPSWEGDPAYSRDGRHIVYVRETNYVGDIWIMNADGSNKHPITSNKYCEHGPCFSQDGSQILFGRRLGLGELSLCELFVINTNGTGERRITSNEIADSFPDCSPVSGEFAFTSRRQQHDQVWLGDFSNTPHRPLTINESSPVFSPDGRTIVFISDRECPFEYDIYTQGISDTTARRITSTGGYKSSPCYLPDGSGILFLQEPRLGKGDILVVDVSSGRIRKLATNR